MAFQFIFETGCFGNELLGEVRRGTARSAEVRCGLVRFGEVGFGVAWFFNSSLQKDALKKLDQGEAWHGAVGCGKARHGLVW
jgi:hypothetical protein